MNGELGGRVALVTGAAGGIGRAIAEALTVAAAKVIATDLGAERPGWLDATARYLPLDVTAENAWDTALAQIDQLDILVHNAGRVLVKTVEATTLDDWRHLFAVNVQSAFLGTRAALPLLRASRYASIIMMSSIAGLGGGAMLGGYCATKGAVRLFAKACAMEFASAGIRVNSVHPGGIDTPMMNAIGEAYAAAGVSASAGEAIAATAALHPLGHLARPEDIAEGVLFLASDRSRFMTGAELVIDGGFTAH